MGLGGSGAAVGVRQGQWCGREVSSKLCTAVMAGVLVMHDA